MEKVNRILRVFTGIIMVFFGSNRLITFLPEPPWPQRAQEFLDALVNSGFVMNLIGITDVLVGLLLIFNRYVALALIIMFPILLNAILFHLILAPETMLFAVLGFALNVYLLFINKNRYGDLLLKK